MGKAIAGAVANRVGIQSPQPTIILESIRPTIGCAYDNTIKLLGVDP
ncbi:MAG: hypothetical protein RIC14_12695 [Filomicrobium sp.]